MSVPLNRNLRIQVEKALNPSQDAGIGFGGDNMSEASGIKSLATQRFDGDDGPSFGLAAPLTAAEIRVEDASDGRARVSLTLPWASAIGVLDLLQQHDLRLFQNA